MEVDGQHRDVVSHRIAIVGAGPAGLMAAEVLADAGHAVALFDQMPSPGRKLLIAGRGGLNLTHSEPLEAFLARFGPPGVSQQRIAATITDFPPAALIDWAHKLGQETFVGSSGRVFPKAMKASPLLRAWLQRLSAAGVELHARHRWTGWAEDGTLTFATPDDPTLRHRPDATILALGGASWPRLGSTGTWTTLLASRGVPIVPLTPFNCGIRIAWSAHLLERFEGEPLKRVAITCGDTTARGEAVLTGDGLEGGAVYALNRAVRDALQVGAATIMLDLRPDITVEELARRLALPRGKQSMATVLRKAAYLSPVAAALLREGGDGATPLPATPEALAARIKGVALTVTGLAGLERAISTSGGIAIEALDPHFMLRALPGVFAAGEMLDWDAPTGGYLLQASFATGAAAARGAMAWLGGEAAPA